MVKGVFATLGDDIGANSKWSSIGAVGWTTSVTSYVCVFPPPVPWIVIV